MRTLIEIILALIALYCIVMHVIGYLASEHGYDANAPAMSVLILTAAVSLGFLGLML